MTHADLTQDKEDIEIKINNPNRDYWKPWNNEKQIDIIKEENNYYDSPSFLVLDDPLSSYYSKGRRLPINFDKVKLGIIINNKLKIRWTSIYNYIKNTNCYRILDFDGSKYPPINGRLIININDILYNTNGYWEHKILLGTKKYDYKYQLHRKSTSLLNNDNDMNFEITSSSPIKLPNTTKNCEVYALSNSYDNNFVLTNKNSVSLHNECGRIISILNNFR